MESNGHAPDSLRDRIVADLAPVRPLARPWHRALILAPIGLALLIGVPLVYSVRSDQASLGAFWLWGVSFVELASAVLLVVAALRDVVPGLGMGLGSRVVLIGSGLALTLAVTYLTWTVSPTTMPARVWWPFTAVCFRASFGNGLPVLAVTLLLASRGVMWRPAFVGAVAGLASGLMSDAGWRLFCNVSEPEHVLLAHVGAIVALTLLGTLVAVAWARLAARRGARADRSSTARR
jgi:hypothetical protein